MGLFKKNKKLEPEQQVVQDMLERVCLVMQLKNFAAIERHFGFGQGWTTNSVKRGSKPYSLLEQVAKETKTSLDYLVFGTPHTNVNQDDLKPVNNGARKALLSLRLFGFFKNAELSDEQLEFAAQTITEKIEEEHQANAKNEQKKTA